MNDIMTALYDWNPWFEGEFPEELQGIQRETDLTTYLQLKEIKIIEGARRVGKSTLLYQVIKKVLQTNENILYINFDDEILNKYSLKEIYSTFLEHRKVDYLFVDEIQHCAEWVSFIRKMYDTRNIKQIYITGSNSSLIKQEYARLLTGRTITIRVPPLQFKEYLAFKGIQQTIGSTKQQAVLKKAFKSYMEEGGFPEIAKQPYARKELLTNYFEDFIYKDIVTRYNVNANKIKELTIYLASNIAKPISYRKIANALNTSPITVQNHINYLKETYLLQEIYKHSHSLKKQYKARKKPYFIETGMPQAISFKFSEDKGRILENIVFNNIKNSYIFEEKHECDFVIKKGNTITQAIQVCFELTDDNRKREYDGLLEAMTTHNLKEGLLLTLDQEDELSIEGKTIHIKPAWKWLLTES